MLRQLFLKKLETIKKITLFALVGGVGVIVNTTIFYSLIYYLSWHYLGASIIATEAAIVNNFLGNNFLTFRQEKQRTIWQRFIRFQLISLITIIGTAAILWLLISMLGSTYLIIWNIAAILLMFVVNFVLNKKFTWTGYMTKESNF